MRHNFLASVAANPFAHLLGLKHKAAKAAADDGDTDTAIDDVKDPEETDDGDEADTLDADDPPVEDQEDGKKGKKGKKAKAADAPVKDDPAASDDGDDPTASAPKDAACRAAFRAGALAERARGQAIFASPAAGVRPDVAAQLAFSTGMPAKAAIAVLETSAIGGRPGAQGLGDRMADARIPNPGADGAGDSKGRPSLAAQIIAAGKKRRAEAA